MTSRLSEMREDVMPVLNEASFLKAGKESIRSHRDLYRNKSLFTEIANNNHSSLYFLIIQGNIYIIQTNQNNIATNAKINDPSVNSISNLSTKSMYTIDTAIIAILILLFNLFSHLEVIAKVV